MNIRKNIIRKMSEINFLSDNRQSKDTIVLITNLKEAEKSINSTRWENFVLEKTGDFTSFLSINYPDLDQHWNELVVDVKQNIVPKIQSKLDELICKEKLTSKMVDQIMFDIVTISVYLEYNLHNSAIKSEFIEEIYELYKSGYIPCGYSNHKYKVF